MNGCFCEDCVKVAQSSYVGQLTHRNRGFVILAERIVDIGVRRLANAVFVQFVVRTTPVASDKGAGQ